MVLVKFEMMVVDQLESRSDLDQLVETPPCHVVVDSSLMTKPAQSGNDARISVLEERSDWHRNIGWGVAGLFASALVALVTWWIPREATTLRDSIKSDTAAQLEPMKLDMAKISVLMQLKQSKSVSEAIRLGLDYSQPQLAIAAIKAVAQQAKLESLPSQTSTLIEANDRIKEAVGRNPSLISDGWTAQLALVSYRSTLPIEPNPKSLGSAPSTFHGLMIKGGRALGFHQKLDGIFWKNYTFENSEIEYDGGPLLLENVSFINCTFKMVYSKSNEQFASLLLERTAATGSIG